MGYNRGSSEVPRERRQRSWPQVERSRKASGGTGQAEIGRAEKLLLSLWHPLQSDSCYLQVTRDEGRDLLHRLSNWSGKISPKGFVGTGNTMH